MGLTLEAGARHKAVVFARVVVHHLHAVRIERLIKIIRVEHAHHVVLINAGERHIVLSVEVQAHHGSAAAAECIAQTTVLPEIYRRTGQILRGDVKAADLAEAVQPVAEKHHRRTGGAAFAAYAVRAVAVQTVQHDVADSLRRDILTLKQECERVEHGGWTAVIFGKLVAQRIFHRGTFFRVAYSYRITI